MEELFLLNNKIDQVADRLEQFKQIVELQLEQIKETLSKETTIEIRSNGNYIIKDKVKFYSDLYNEVEKLKRLKYIPKFLHYLLTILLIINLLITIFKLKL